MQLRSLGNFGLTVSAVGLGCVGMSEFYGEIDRRQAIRTIEEAIELGITLFDTADIYGLGENERLLGEAIAPHRADVSIATKFGNLRSASGEFIGIDGRPEYVLAACDRSLRRLGVDVIDLYQLHRTDPKTPIEETVGAMHDLVQAGKVRYLGLSEAVPADIERAARVAPITSLQSEYSVLERTVELEVMTACQRNLIGFIAYAPLGRGLLTGRIHGARDFKEGDSRRQGRYPRLAGVALTRNVELAEVVNRVARSTGYTPTQIALSWLLAQSESVVPIPGARRVLHVRENVAAVELRLGEDVLELLDGIVGEGGHAHGDRYSPGQVPNWASPQVGLPSGDQ